MLSNCCVQTYVPDWHCRRIYVTQDRLDLRSPGSSGSGRRTGSRRHVGGSNRENAAGREIGGLGSRELVKFHSRPGRALGGLYVPGLSLYLL